MKKFFQKIIKFFRLKSPCCNSRMTTVGEHNGSLVYVCNECLKAWF